MKVSRIRQKYLKERLQQNGFPSNGFGRKYGKLIKKKMLMIAMSRKHEMFSWAVDFTNEDKEEVIELWITRDKRTK